MKRLTISEFKKNMFNTIAIVSHVSDFDIRNIKKIQKDLSETDYELDSLKEAIFFKREKFKGKLNEQKEQMMDELCKELKNNLKEIHIKEIDNSSTIIRRKKDLVELERLENVLRYLKNLDESNKQLLDSLFTSEEIEDWILLADIIYSELSFGSGDKSIFLNYSKKLEDKISDIFRDAVSKNQINLCKSCNDAMDGLDKQEVLMDLFLLSKNLLTTEVNVHPPLLEIVDFGKMTVKDTTFNTFLNEILQLLEENSFIIYKIFDDPADYMISKIFKTSISINLGNFLNVGNSAIFLMCLQSAYLSLDLFVEKLKSVFPRINVSGNINEIFAPFLYRAILKEAQLFDEILEIFLSGARSLVTYVVNSKKVEKTANYIKIYEDMFILVDSFLNRKKLFYSAENEHEIMKIFSKKLTLVIGKIISSDADEISMMNDLVRMYILNKKILGDKGQLFCIFNDKLKESIKEVFNLIVEKIKKMIKNEISKIDFNNENSHMKLISHLKDVSAKVDGFGEKNFKIILQKIIPVLLDELYIQILNNHSEGKKLNNMLRCMDGILGYFSLNNVYLQIEPGISHLKLICRLVESNGQEFKNLLEREKAKLDEKEIHEITKQKEQKHLHKAEKGKS